MKLLQSLLFIAVTLFVESIYSAPINLQSTTNLPTIIVSTPAEAPYSNETHDGFIDELATLLFRKIGYQLIIENVPAERALRLANKGSTDGDISRIAGIDKFYPNLIQIPESVVSMDFVVFSKKPINLQKGWSALADKNLAYIIGWKIFDKLVPKSADITRTKDSHELFILLQKQRTDYALYIRWEGFYLIKKLKLKGIQLQLPVLANKKMFMYLHNKHKALVPKLATYLTKMKNDGSYQRLLDKHLLPLK